MIISFVVGVLMLMGCQTTGGFVAAYPDGVSCPKFSPAPGGFMTYLGHGGGTRPIAHTGVDIEAPAGTPAMRSRRGWSSDQARRSGLWS